MSLDYYVHPSSVIDEGVQIGVGTNIWHFSHIQKNAKIGSNCNLGQNVYVANDVCIGNSVKIQNNVSIFEGVILGDYVFCGPSVVFTNVLFPRSEFPNKQKYIKTNVERGASLGANATIICGVNIGQFSIVGAGSVVTKDLPNYALVIGNPSQIVGWVCRCGKKLEFYDLLAICKECSRKYLMKEEDEVIEIRS
ncbi:MAG: N-acetyltransferase [Calditrichaeota bacterium]|nr:MAG: N-acetyltransferase [Calditrichota bacterium]